MAVSAQDHLDQAFGPISAQAHLDEAFGPARQPQEEKPKARSPLSFPADPFRPWVGASPSPPPPASAPKPEPTGFRPTLGQQFMGGLGAGVWGTFGAAGDAIARALRPDQWNAFGASGSPGLSGVLGLDPARQQASQAVQGVADVYNFGAQQSAKMASDFGGNQTPGFAGTTAQIAGGIVGSTPALLAGLGVGAPMAGAGSIIGPALQGAAAFGAQMGMTAPRGERGMAALEGAALGGLSGGLGAAARPLIGKIPSLIGQRLAQGTVEGATQAGGTAAFGHSPTDVGVQGGLGFFTGMLPGPPGIQPRSIAAQILPQVEAPAKPRVRVPLEAQPATAEKPRVRVTLEPQSTPQGESINVQEQTQAVAPRQIPEAVQDPRAAAPAESPATVEAPAAAGAVGDWEARVLAARERITQKVRGSQPLTGLDPQDVADAVVIAADAVRRGVKSFDDFARQMEAEYGPGIKPYLQSAWQGAQQGGGVATQLDAQSNAQRVAEMYERQEAAWNEARSTSVGAIVRRLNRGIFGTSANLDAALDSMGPVGHEAKTRMDLSRGASEAANLRVREAANQIYGDLPFEEEQLLDHIIQSRRTMAIDAYRTDVAHTEGLTAIEHADYLADLPSRIGGQKFAELNIRADAYFARMAEVVDRLHAEGMLTDTQRADLLAKGDYSKRNFIDEIDPEELYDFGTGRTESVRSSGIEQLKGGSEGYLVPRTRLLMEEVLTRAEGRIFRNRAAQAMLDVAVSVPNNGVVEADPGGKLPKGKTRVSAMVGGVRQDMLMPNEMAREFVKSDPIVAENVSRTLGILTGAPIMKAGATGYNPEFAITNIPRDMMMIYMNTDLYSWFPPLFVAQHGYNMLATGLDVALKRGRYRQFIMEGGGLDWQTQQGRLRATMPPFLQKNALARFIVDALGPTVGRVERALGWAGQTSEALNRVAIMRRAQKKGLPVHEAVAQARGYLDFNKGGNWIKFADAMLPYLNVKVQAAHSTIKAIKKRPALWTWKAANVGFMAGLLAYWNRVHNKEGYEQVSSEEKARNFVYVTNASYIDQDGNQRWHTIRIPKDQFQQPISAVFEGIVAKMMGDPVDADQLANAARDATLLTPNDLLPPILKGLFGYAMNKNFWLNEDIWRGDEVEPWREFTNRTSPAFVKVGEVTGLSPERAQYAAEQVFVPNNTFVYLLGQAEKAIEKAGSDEPQRPKTQGEKIASIPFVRRVVKPTNPFERHRQRIEQTRIAENTRLYDQEQKLYSLLQADSLQPGPESRKRITDLISKEPAPDRQRLADLYKRYKRLEGIPDRVWWLQVSKMPTPETRALEFYRRYQDADPEERRRLIQTARRVPNMASLRFLARFRQLMRSGEGGGPQTISR